MTHANSTATSPAISSVLGRTLRKVLAPAWLCAVLLPGCAVDAPERANFDYSFLDALPEEVSPPEPDLPLAAAPVTASIQVEFLDGWGAYSDNVAKLDKVRVDILGIDALMQGEEGEVWLPIRSDAIEVDLLAVKDGDSRTIARGPMPEGDFSALRLHIGDAFVDEGGQKSALQLPGDLLLIEGDYELFERERTTLTVAFGGLRGLSQTADGEAWEMDPHVTVSVETTADDGL